MGDDYRPAIEFDLRCELAARRLEAAALTDAPTAKDFERSNAQTIALNAEKRLCAYVALADGETPMELLAKWREVSAEVAEFAWACVAVAMHGLIPRDAIPGHDLHRGLGAAAYAAMLSNPVLGRSLASVLLHSRLVTEGLLRRDKNDVRSPAVIAYQPSPLLVAYLLGRDLVHPQIAYRRGPSMDAPVFDAEQKQIRGRLVDVAARSGELVLVHGSAGSGRRTAIRSAVPATVSVNVRHVASESVPELMLDLRAIVMLTGANAILEGVDLLDIDRDAKALGSIAEAVDALSPAAFAPVSVWKSQAPLRWAPIDVHWPKPSLEARHVLWERATAAANVSLPSSAIERLARRCPAGPRTIHDALTPFRQSSWQSASELTEGQVMDGLRASAATMCADLGRFVPVLHNWTDLVLPSSTQDQIELVVSRALNAERVLGEWGYGDKVAGAAGTTVLISGAPGTGKTMIAGVIARSLGLGLFAVDFSRILSKWIGETEGRLSRMFEAAETGSFALIIDEVDGLIAQRTHRVESANDRYSNLEIGYLLERLDRFSGVAILTTNLDATLDKALHRRLTAHIRVPAPGERERALLWTRHAETGRAPIGPDVDPADLARRFPAMSGGNIRNAVLNAAYIAADEDASTIMHAHFVRGGRMEYDVMGEAPATMLRRVPPEGN